MTPTLHTYHAGCYLTTRHGQVAFDVTYPNGQRTIYTAPMPWRGLISRRGGLGHLLAQLQRGARLGLIGAITVSDGTSQAGSAARAHQRALAADPGDLSGWAETIEQGRATT